MDTLEGVYIHKTSRIVGLSDNVYRDISVERPSIDTILTCLPEHSLSSSTALNRNQHHKYVAYTKICSWSNSIYHL